MEDRGIAESDWSTLVAVQGYYSAAMHCGVTRLSGQQEIGPLLVQFPNAACVVSLVDRLVHRAEVISIEGESYRLKEARERNEARARQRKTRKPPTKTETA